MAHFLEGVIWTFRKLDAIGCQALTLTNSVAQLLYIPSRCLAGQSGSYDTSSDKVILLLLTFLLSQSICGHLLQIDIKPFVPDWLSTVNLVDPSLTRLGSDSYWSPT